MSTTDTVFINEQKVNHREPLTLSIEVTVSRGQAELLMKSQPDGQTFGSYFGGLATFLLQQLADGGLMVDAASVRQIEDACGRVRTGADIARVLENAAGRDGGRLKATWFIDPINEGSLKDLAYARGMTVEQLVQEGMDWVMDQGWLWQLNADQFQIRLTNEQRQTMERALNVEYLTGQDLYNFVLEQATLPLIADEKPKGGKDGLALKASSKALGTADNATADTTGAAAKDGGKKAER